MRGGTVQLCIYYNKFGTSALTLGKFISGHTALIWQAALLAGLAGGWQLAAQGSGLGGGGGRGPDNLAACSGSADDGW
jgi:hypothetical protein